MPRMHQLSFTSLELKGLWVRLTGGTTDDDQILDLATETALDKIYRAEKGMPGRQSVGAAYRKAETRGPELDVQRRRKGESAA